MLGRLNKNRKVATTAVAVAVHVQTPLVVPPVAAAATTFSSGSAISAVEVDADVDLAHLSRVLSAGAGAVLLRPVRAVVDVRAERVGELGVTALALLAQHVRRLEVLAQQNVVTAAH